MTTSTTTLFSVYAPNRQAAETTFASLKSSVELQASKMASYSMPSLSVPSQTEIVASAASGTAASSSTGGANRNHILGGSGITAAWLGFGGLWLGVLAVLAGVLAVAL